MFAKKIFLLLSTVLILSACETTTTPQHIDKKDNFAVVQDTKLYNYRTLPKRNELPATTVLSSKNVALAAQCIQDNLKQRFKLPDGFYEMKSYADRGTTVSLMNPFTQIEGLVFEVVPDGLDNSKINLYANGTMLSTAWQALPNSCQ